MKIKITLTIITILSCLIGRSQINNWDSVVVDGFGVYEKINYIYSHNNTLYAGTQQVTQGVAPQLYSSTSGDEGTWTATGFNSIASVFDVNVIQMLSDTSVSGKVYIATENSEDGVGIYSYDGSNWVNMSGVIPPWDSSFYTCAKMLLYSSGTGNDSLFVFLNKPSNNASQIWKTDRSNISWSLVIDLPAGASRIKDAIVYNDSIFYINEDGGTGFSYLYKMSNGSDTVKANVNPGINSSSNALTSLGIFKNYLYVGSNNFSGTNINRYNPQTGWELITSDGFGYGFGLYTINSFHTYRNRLWFTATGSYGAFINGARINGNNATQGGPNTVQVFMSKDGVNFNQSATDGFRDINNFGSSWTLTSLGNNMYAGGSNYNSLIGGQIWRSSVPLASFTNSAPDTVCGGTNITFSNTSQGATYYSWLINGSAYSSAADTNYTMPSSTSDTISLVAYSADLSYTDTFSVVKTSYVISSNANVSPTYCIGSTVYPGTILNLYYGLLPYSYSWTDGDTTILLPSPAFTIVAPTSYTLIVNDARGCSAGFSTPIVNVFPNTDIVGHVTNAAATNIDNGYAYAFKYQPGGAGFDTVSFVNLDSGTGNYLFAGLDSGTYLIKILPNALTFPLAIPTYYGNTFQWDSSLVVSHGCSANTIADIQVIEVAAATGPGIVSGYIIEQQGYGTGNRFYDGGNHPNLPFAPGGPLKGIDVKLGKNPGGGIQARTMSDSTGYYEFNNLPLQGYKVYVDIPNLPMDSTRELVLATGTEVSTQNNYFADSASVYVNPGIVVGMYASQKVYENKFSVYPNPTTSIINIEFDLLDETAASIEVANMLGQIVFETKTKSSNATLNLEHLQAGVYYISLLKDETKATQRLVVVKK